MIPVSTKELLPLSDCLLDFTTYEPSSYFFVPITINRSRKSRKPSRRNQTRLHNVISEFNSLNDELVMKIDEQ